MPFVSKHEMTPVIQDWGVAKGSVRHILVEEDNTHASYVIEEPPGVKSIKMVVGKQSWSHDAFLPWRYSAIRVRWDGRVSLANCGWIYFSSKKAETVDEKVLFPAVLPNVFENGSICLGYGSLWDRSPVRSAWKAVRRIYSESNMWIHSRVPKDLILQARERDCNDHVCKGGIRDFLCQWSKLSLEQVMAVEWSDRNSSVKSPYSILNAAFNCSSTKVYQGEYQFDDYHVSQALRVAEGTRR